MRARMQATRNLLSIALLWLYACAERESSSVDDAAVSIPSAARDSSSARPDGTPLREQFGEYTLIYSVVRSDALADDVARRHGVPSNADAALLNVTVQHRGANIPAEVNVRAVNLAQQSRDVEMIPTVASDLVSYLGVVEVEDLPYGATTPFTFTFRESFFPTPG